MALPPLLKPMLTRLAPVLFTAGLAHLVYQIWQHWDVVTLDFRFFWLAGEFWTVLQSPYDPAFAQAAEARFGITQGANWYYTPNWFLIASFLSVFDPIWGSRIWSVINALLLLAASLLNVAAFVEMRGRTALIRANAPFTIILRSLSPIQLFMLHAGFMALAQAAGNTLHLGQSSMLIYFGASLLVFASTNKHENAGAAGLALLMLKPQIGLMVVAALALSAYGRRVIIAGALMSFLLAVPALAITPMPEIIAQLISSTTLYDEQSYNLAAAMTGLRHFIWAAGGPELGAAFYLVLTLAAVSAIGIAGQKRVRKLRTIDAVMIAIAATLFFAPLHVYDFMLAGVLLLYCACLAPPAGMISVAAFLLLWRAGNLPQPAAAQGPDITYYAGSLYASAAIVAIFCVLIVSLAPRMKRRPARWKPPLPRPSVAA